MADIKRYEVTWSYRTGAGHGQRTIEAWADSPERATEITYEIWKANQAERMEELPSVEKVEEVAYGVMSKSVMRRLETQLCGDLQERYDALFYLYVDHIHEHRLGAIPAEQCSSCFELANNLINKELKKRQNELSKKEI